MFYLHLFFGRPLLLLPETSSLSDFAQIYVVVFSPRAVAKPLKYVSRKVSTGFTCASFLMSSFLMWSNLLPIWTSSFRLNLVFLFYGPTFTTVYQLLFWWLFWRLCISPSIQSHLVVRSLRPTILLQPILSGMASSTVISIALVSVNIWPEWQFFNVAGYLYVIEESRRSTEFYASPRGHKF